MNQPSEDWRDSGIETQTLMFARVRDVALRELVRIRADGTLREAARAMHDHQTGCVLVDAGAQTGLVTDSSLRDALALDDFLVDGPVTRVAHRPLLTIDSGALLLDALLQMQRHGVNRLLVTDRGSISAVLEQTDVLGFFAINSNVVLQQAGQADRPADLKPAVEAMVRLAGALLRNGMKPERIGRLVSDVNRAVFRRIFHLIVPEEFRHDVCFIVMGSEGRREQILPTDQDNALIVRDGVTVESVLPACRAISDALNDLGYPRCSGDIMLSNPYWVLSQTELRNRISNWIVSSGNDDVMNLSIFFDAAAVAGDESLLSTLKAVMFEAVSVSDAFCARFASAINAFPVPIGIFSRLQLERSGEQAGTLDIKKGGVFPVVHGIRSLALQKGLAVTPTLERIEALVEVGVLERRFAREIAEAFGFMSTLRAESGLAAMRAGVPATNRIRPAELTNIDQEILLESLRVVVRLRKLIGQHFRLDLLGF